MSQSKQQFDFMGFHRAAQILSSVLVVAAGAPAGAGAFVPVCEGGAVRYVLIDFESETPPAPGGDEGACHGPCVNARRDLLKPEGGVK